MPITQSAKKALRQSKRRRALNIAKAKALKEAIKNFNKKPTRESFVEAQKAQDKAAKAHVIHRNRAARLKSGLSKLLAGGGK